MLFLTEDKPEMECKDVEERWHPSRLNPVDLRIRVLLYSISYQNSVYKRMGKYEFLFEETEDKQR